MRPLQRRKPMIIMQRLCRLPRQDVNALKRIKQISRIQEMVIQRQHVLMQRKGVENPRLVHQRVHALRLVPFEIVAARLASRPSRLGVVCQLQGLIFGCGHGGSIKGVSDDDEAVLVDLIDEILHAGVWRLRYAEEPPVCPDLVGDGASMQSRATHFDVYKLEIDKNRWREIKNSWYAIAGRNYYVCSVRRERRDKGRMISQDKLYIYS